MNYPIFTMNNNKDNYSSLHSLSEEAGRNLAGKIPGEASVEALANLMQALSDPTRVRIIFLLTKEELCVHDLATLIGATQSSISHHLKTLRLNDLVESRRDGKTVYYSLADEHVAGLFEECMEHVNRE